MVQDLSVPYLIASAKHGLLPPETPVAPYDLDLEQLPPDQRLKWASGVLKQLQRNAPPETVFLLSGAYAEAIKLANAALAEPLKILLPLADSTPVVQDEWIRWANDLATRFRDVRRLYEFIELARCRKETFFLRDLSHRTLPERGVYVFLDPTERSGLCRGPRIVRIGTHAVSQGSGSTLRARLRNHMGPSHGAGGHRGSVFRMHVGRAILNANPAVFGAIPSWGVGQQATREILNQESQLEKMVSDYLGNLEVFLIAINDAPSKDSMRAKVETQLISLMTAAGVPLETPSPDWLGRHSVVPEIATTGLWNVRDVGRPYWPSRKGSVAQIVEGTL